MSRRRLVRLAFLPVRMQMNNSNNEYAPLKDESHVEIHPLLHVNSEIEDKILEERKKIELFYKTAETDHGILRDDNVGLAFSGGGIRSAAFNSGGFPFDYLSTVSGGGFLGAAFISHCIELSKKTLKANSTAGQPNGKKHNVMKIPTTVDLKGISPEIQEQAAKETVSKMAEKSRYLTRQGGLFTGLMSLVLAFATDFCVYTASGVLCGHVIKSFHGSQIMHTLNNDDWSYWFEPFVYIVMYGTLIGLVVLFAGFPLLAILSRILRFLAGNYHPLENWADRFSSPTALWTYLPKTVMKAISFLGVAGTVFGGLLFVYWVEILLICMWGKISLDAGAATESAMWALSTIFSIASTLIANVFQENFLGSVLKAVMLLVFGFLGPFGVVLTSARFNLWLISYEMCQEDGASADYPRVCSETGRFALFDLGDFSFQLMEAGIFIVLIIWIFAFEETEIALHEFWRIKIASAFFAESEEHLKLEGMPDKPYFLINTTVNSIKAWTNRKVHSFVFSKYVTGSHVTGYATTSDVYTRTQMSSAVAISSAAIATETGLALQKLPDAIQWLISVIIGFYNISLGKWVYHPQRYWRTIARNMARICLLIISLWGPFVLLIMAEYDVTRTAELVVASSWLFMFVLLWIICLVESELFRKHGYITRIMSFSPIGRNSLQSLGLDASLMGMVYLSDGGHFENLGAYELLRRENKTVYAFDAGYDPEATLVALSDLLDLALQDNLITRFTYCKKYSPKNLMPDPITKITEGRVVRVFLEYPSGKQGVLWYVKMQLIKDENVYVLMRHKEFPTFPHHPTSNQNLSTELFYAYHELGFESAKHLFEIIQKEKDEHKPEEAEPRVVGNH